MSLEKDFVPYEELLELKELGFDEPTLYHWHNNCNTHPFTNEVFNPNCRPKTNSGIKDIGEESHTWSAPTFSQAFRWFREKHEVVGIVKFGTNDFTFNIYNSDGFGLLTKESLAFNGTYEEAELACLRMLIKIAKNEIQVNK